MKPLLILIAGCLPLAILTALSVLELRSIEDAPGMRGAALDPPGNTTPDDKARKQVRAEKPLVEGLGEVDFLSSETLPGLSELPAESSLQSLQDAWPQWIQARQLVQRSLKIERGVQAAEADQLQEACRRLEELRTEYEKTKPPGSESLLALLDRRIASLKGQIARAALKSESDALLAQARAEFQPKRYAQCFSLCDQWLAKYSQLDAAQTAEMRVLRERSQFWDEVEQMSAQWQAAESAARRKTLMEGFLEKHSRGSSRTAREQEVLDRCQGELSKISARLRAEETSRAAAEEIRRLRESPPARLGDRLQAAVALGQKNPIEEAVAPIRKQAREWLAEALPEKPIQEPAEMQETETRQGEVVRGFFRQVTKPDGALVGYQRYPTYEQYLHPVSQVGTYAKEDLLRAPGPSLPRQYVTRYAELRGSVLAQPGRKQAWEELLAACEEFEATLSAYRTKSGSSKEPLSFQDEARIARSVLDNSAWDNMEKLFGR